ncbi:hypothetical protein [Methylosinus sp. PW1]|uniref:hypothetical protein n=1 Tax=Methylosinus sp. PW1 TaxID=107636 RepID=UPI0012EB65AD|nr:hypothetical protein [Methylosinus sp. PW1]
MSSITETQKLAIEYVLSTGAERAVRACDADGNCGAYRGENEIIAYGTLPSIDRPGWYFAGYADDLAAWR